MPVWLLGLFTPKNFKILGGVVVAGLLVWGVYYGINKWEDSIRSNERLEMKADQLEQVLADQEELKKRTAELEQINSDILSNVQASNDTVIERHTEVREYINTPEAQSSNNQEPAEVIRNTIRMLKDENR